MRVIVAPDSLKESLTAQRAAQAIGRGLLRAVPSVELDLVPVADGGDGTAAALVSATGGRMLAVEVANPLGRPVRAAFGLLGDGGRAVVEMAAASGLALLDRAERNPLLTSTRGTGQLIRAAVEAGAREVLVGIGGSATVDGGTGMAAELGVEFLDAGGNLIPDLCGGRLADISRIDMSGLDAGLAGVRFSVACDVTNPLVGPQGAARVYGPQKGADPPMVERLEQGMENLARVIARDVGRDVAALPGAGAAGGLGAGLVALLDAEICSGVEAVIEAVGLRERVRGSDLVITAEGRVDGQSAFGKAPAGVASVAKDEGVPVVVLAGSVGPGHEKLYEQGVSAVLAICDGPMALEDALRDAERLLQQAGEAVMRLWRAAAGDR